MRKSLTSIILLTVFLGIVGFIIYTQEQHNRDVPFYQIGEPSMGNIKVKRKIKGNIIPAEEIKVKSTINGKIKKIFVEVGGNIKEGDKIALIKNLSEPLEIENLRSLVKLKEIQYDLTLQEYERERGLFKKGLTPLSDFEKFESSYEKAKQSLKSAKDRLQMATTGLTATEKELSNIVYAPSSGIIYSLNVKNGYPVIKQNNYNEGTTIATIANMDSMIFMGEIFEKDLNVIKEGMPIMVETQVLKDTVLNALITNIYPKGRDIKGIIKFPIEAVINYKGKNLWGGVNAKAIAIINQIDSVLTLEEKYLSYENDSCYVWKKFKDEVYKKTKVNVGISDGLKIEIISGLNKNDKIKLPD